MVIIDMYGKMDLAKRGIQWKVEALHMQDILRQMIVYLIHM